MTISLTTCPSNLKEAIDWILRVTGRDGQNPSQQGKQAIQTLTQKVKDLLKDVKDVLPGFNKEDFEKVTKALADSGGSDGLITTLAEGLQQFIGYENRKNGLITGAGIAPSNMATHRLCDAAIAFTIGVLESLKGHGDVKRQPNMGKVEKVITVLHEQYGKGTKALETVTKPVKNALDNLLGGVQGFVKQLGDAFDDHLKQLDDDTNKLAEKVEKYFKDVFNKGSGNWGNANGLSGKLQTLVEAFKTKDAIYELSKLKGKVEDVAKHLHPTTTSNLTSIKAALSSGKWAFISQLQKGNYTPTNYEKTVLQNTINVTHAKIFLSCLPLLFNNLSYFYWQCREGGPWQNQNLTGGPLSPFMEGHWFRNSYMNENMTGTSVVRNVLDKKFQEFSTAAQAVSKKSYSDFFKELKSKGQQTWQRASVPPSPVSNTNYLSGLYILCTSYFQCQQIKSAEKASKNPQTIREMLYFLAALQFSPQYDGLEKHITSLFTKGPLDVAISGSPNKDETLSADQIKEYLITSCSVSACVVGIIQGSGGSEKADDPFFHQLFCNNMGFTYTSGPTLLNYISNYAYALQFQLSFLYQQCSGTYSKACGWNECRYGSTVKFDGVQSHICATGCTTGGHSSGNHTDLKDCQHDNCGSTKASPLQAFLTDKLKGFCQGHPSDPSSHLATCSGSMCHVPMGFKPTDLSSSPNGDSLQGNHISATLKPFCGSYNTPLRQLSEKLGCVTARTPRTVGDVFGFVWHLNSQLFKTRPKMQELARKLVNAIGTPNNSKVPHFLLRMLEVVGNGAAKATATPIGLSRSLETMAPAIPFLYQLFMAKDPNTLPGALFDLTKHCHKWDRSGQLKHESHSSGKSCPNPNDLWSLYQGLTATARQNKDIYEDCRKANCGGYLYPLTHTFGSTFAPKHASSYLSWFIHLTDDLEAGLREILERFKGLSCTNCKINCHSDFTGSPSCSCPSLLECADVLPLLYDCGFSFNNAYYLKGVKYDGQRFQPDPQNNRTCGKFSNQLSAVLDSTQETPLLRLLLTIDDFLYLFRFYFCYNLSAIWMLYLCIIIYTLFFILDTLHIRSHLRFSSSHILPPTPLLTAGKALALTKLGYFAP
ncbi:extracellular matrix-binding ebh [Babesia caballi]|uniref:Extracellular matrix-binding ebh n=1 Tax=Babesia caballi TaxID=5871 RepID=A0AAV4LZL3_BABCB|nr:extracellular matrix-binding ebh [Babesia caballi]